MDDEAALGMHRAAVEHHARLQVAVTGGDVHLCKHFTQRVLGRLVDQHAHRPVLVVLADQRDAAGKGRVEQRRQRDEEVIGEGGRRYRHGPILPAGGGMVAQRRRTAMG